MTERSVVVHPDADLLARAAAARLLTAVLDAQAARGSARIVLTGGGVGIATLAALADLPGLGAVDWSAVDLWWGDERFLPAGHPDRNETQARQALLDRVPVPPERVHPVPPARRGGSGGSPARNGSHARDGSEGNVRDGTHGAVDDAGTAARLYADELAAVHRAEAEAGRAGNPARPAGRGDAPGPWAREGARTPLEVPVLDVVLLGMGPDGHVASLFEGHPALGVHGAATVAVHDSPKPPPVRVSLTLPALRAGREVWLLAAGRAKAAAVARALVPSGSAPGRPEGPVPAALVGGTCSTRWLLDEAAASLLGR